jgi:hypothetical protein
MLACRLEGLPLRNPDPTGILQDQSALDLDPTEILQDESALDTRVRSTPDNALEDDRPLIASPFISQSLIDQFSMKS